MEGKNFRYFEFGEFRIDLRRRILTKNGEIVPLAPRNFDLLLFLIENEGRVLSHDELLDAVWEGAFVEQSNLKTAISILRGTLGESPNQSLFIKTVPRKGYSFVSPVRPLPDESFTESVWLHRTDTQIIVEEEIEDDEEEETELKPVSKIIEIEPTQSPKLLEGKSAKNIRFKLTGRKIAAIVVAGLILLGLGYGLKSYLSRSAFNFAIENVRITKLTGEGNLTSVVASTDGNYLLYPTNEKDGITLFLRQLSTGVLTRLTPPTKGNFWFYNFTPDSSSIYYGVNHSESDKSGLYQVSLLGGPPRRILDQPVGALFSPDGKQMAFIRGGPDRQSGIVVAAPDGSGGREIAVYPENFRIWSLKWSPDGANLLGAIRRQTEGKYFSYIAEISVTDGKETALMPERETIFTNASWLPDKKSILYAEMNPNAELRQIWQYFPASGERRRVTNDDYSYTSLSVLGDGKSFIAAQEATLASIWIGDPEGKNFRQVAGGAANIERAAWTADGRLVYSVTENGSIKICIVSADGEDRRQLTDGTDGTWLHASVAKDGTAITFQSKRSGNPALWQMTLDGKDLRPITAAGTPYAGSKLSADGKTLFYVAYSAPAGWKLYRKNLESEAAQVIDADTGSWAISPDEKFIAFMALDKTAGKNRIFIRSLENGANVNLLDAESDLGLTWTRDGKSLTYAVNTSESSKIIRLSLDKGEKQIVAEFPNERIFGFDWSFDGKQLAVVRGKTVSDAVMISTAEKN
jgi:Tol biopolymer transport system component/DNA-binding winged helix-turn-helix (wHTH) protein